MLDYGSYAVLHQEPLPGNETIKVEPNLTAVSYTHLTLPTILRV